MQEFYIDVEFSRGLTRIQVDEVPPEQWDAPALPQFIVEFHDGHEFVMVTLQLDQGQWYDRKTRLPGDDIQSQAEDADAPDLYYHSPLTSAAIQHIGEAIARHMVVHLTAYLGLFVPVFSSPALN